MSDKTNGLLEQQNPTDANNNASKVQLSTVATAVPNTNAAVMTMPLAMQLPGLATLPLALCAMNASGNIGNAGLLQAATNMVTQPAGVQPGGIFLLNLGANSNNNLALSQIVPQLQQQQQALQPQAVNQVLLGQNTIGLSTVQQPQPTATVQPQNIQQVVPSAGQIQLPSATTSAQQTPAQAFMLVPIQQVPVANAPQASPALQTTAQPTQVLAQSPAALQSTVPSPVQPAVQPQNIAPAQNNAQSLSVVAQQLLNSASNTITTLPQLSSGQLANFKLPAPLAGAQANTLQSLSSYPEVALNYLGLSGQFGATTSVVQAGTYSTNPIHDPHISSTMQSSPFTSGTDSGAAQTMPVQCGTDAQGPLKPDQVASPRISTESLPNEGATVSEPLLDPNFTSPIVSQVTKALSANLQELASAYTSKKTEESTENKTSVEGRTPSAETIQNWPVGLDEFLSSPGGSEQGDKGKKRKKGPAPKLDGNEVCLICRDKASGYHYGVLTCEGCKGFFRRSVIKGTEYKCKGEGKCEMDTYTRRKCQKCRLERCRSAGMKDESVLSEAKAKRIKKEKDCATPFQNVSFDGDPIPTLTPQQRNLVEMLQTNEARFQWPTQENVAKVTPWVESGDEHRIRASRFAHFTELSILIVQLVVEFTKQLPGFMSVSREDQIVLLKACTIEVMLLRAAKQFDKKTKAINFLNGKFYDRNSFYRAGIQVEFVDPIFDFCHSMARLGLDEAEYALLSAINTFSADRPNIKDIEKVEALQDSYVDLLRVYLKIHHPSDPLMFPRTLMKLVELRSLNNYHSEQMFALKVQDKQLPPLLAEIWDM